MLTIQKVGFDLWQTDLVFAVRLIGKGNNDIHIDER
jgi:hypothetical protein